MASPGHSNNPYAAPATYDPQAASGNSPGNALLPATHVRYVVAAALCLAAVAVYIQRNSISVAEERIRSDLSLEYSQMGLVMSAFFFSYALLQLPASALVQWLGVRRSLTFFVALSSFMSAAMAVAGGYIGLIGVRACMGLAQAGCFPAAAAAVSQWIPPQRRGIVNGLLGGFMSVGGAAGAFLTGLLLPTLSWQAIFALFAVPGLAWAAWFFLWFRNRPEQHRGVNAAERELIVRSVATGAHKPPAQGGFGKPARTGPVNQRRLPAIFALAALCAQQTFRGAGYVFFASWFATYLRETHGVKDMAAGLLNGLPLMAVVVGSPLGGVLVDAVLARTGSHRLSRQGVAIGASLICAVLIVLSLPVANPWWAVALISAGSFFASFGGPCAYCAAIDIGGRYTPLSFGLMNMMGNLGSAIFPLVIPWLLQARPGETGSGNWRLVLFCFAGMYLATAICWTAADTSQRLSADDA